MTTHWQPTNLNLNQPLPVPNYSEQLKQLSNLPIRVPLPSFKPSAESMQELMRQAHRSREIETKSSETGDKVFFALFAGALTTLFIHIIVEERFTFSSKFKTVICLSSATAVTILAYSNPLIGIVTLVTTLGILILTVKPPKSPYEFRDFEYTYRIPRNPPNLDFSRLRDIPYREPIHGPLQPRREVNADLRIQGRIRNLRDIVPMQIPVVQEEPE